MGYYRTARQVADWNPQGRRMCGRPVTTWKNGMRESTKEDTSRMKHVSIESSGGKNMSSGLGKLCIHRKIL
jgi:hypothetical protein